MMRTFGSAIVTWMLATSAQAESFEHAVSVRDNLYFVDVEPMLRALVAEKHRTDKPNHFCVIGQGGSNYTHAYVIWPEGDAFILWEPVMERLSQSRRYLSIRTDVVDDVGSSSYLVSKTWFASLRRQCAEKGMNFVFPPRSA